MAVLILKNRYFKPFERVCLLKLRLKWIIIIKNGSMFNRI